MRRCGIDLVRKSSSPLAAVVGRGVPGAPGPTENAAAIEQSPAAKIGSRNQFIDIADWTENGFQRLD